jgi:redox-sensing transcriptional repressor
MAQATARELAEIGGPLLPNKGAPGLDRELHISDKTITRMRWYLFALDEFSKDGTIVVASHEIANKVGVKSGLVRKDLCHFGGFGRPSVGYNVAYLQKKIKDILRVNQVKNVAWVGAQRLADDPALVEKFAENKCDIVAVFDHDSGKLGLRIGNLQVMGAHQMEQVVNNLGIEAAVIAVTAEHAQWTADKLISGGVKAILNLTPVVLVVPQGVTLRNIDIASELMLLSYYCGDREQKNSASDIIEPA